MCKCKECNTIISSDDIVDGKMFCSECGSINVFSVAVSGEELYQDQDYVKVRRW